jgi:hypothetical protein
MDTLKSSQAFTPLDWDFLKKQTSALENPAPRAFKNPVQQSLYEEEIQARNKSLIDDFSSRRGAMGRRMGSVPGGDVFAAIPRYYTPMDYFRQSHVPFDIHVDQQRIELYKWMDLYYRTHPLIPMMIDIFTRFPLVGIELKSQDKKLKEFYEDQFFDKLNYEQFLVDVGKEYWLFGESFPYGDFNETLGIWTEEELLDPATIDIRRYPIIGGQEFFLKPTKELIDLARKKEPAPFYALLERDFGPIIPFLQKKQPIPISDVLLKQVAFKASTRDIHGTPILLRGLRTLIHEEKLLAALSAVAERLWAPLVLVKLGVQDMGPGRDPFLPGPGEVAQVRDEFDLALSSDFRLVVHHFGIETQTVFGREQMPRLNDDFDRINQTLMMLFGINPSLLGAGSAGQPYASSALQAEFLNQILRTYQKFLADHYRQRAYIVAEAQEHFAYEKRGDTRVPIMEEVLTYDEGGNQVIQQRHKLMIPDIRFKVLDLRDEATQRQFLQALKQQGVPIPDQEIAMGMRYDFDEALEQQEEEMIKKTVAQQEAKVKTYDILMAKGYPVPMELKQEVESSMASQLQPGQSIDMGVGVPQSGDQITMPQPPDMPGVDDPGEGRTPERGTFPEQSLQTMGPQLPAVPGQQGQFGVGTPKPAIGPSPTPGVGT